jgi:sugar lactone lactonase YvrE
MAVGVCLVVGCIPAPNRAKLPGAVGAEGIVRTASPPGMGDAVNISSRVPGVPNVMAPPLQAPSVISNNGGSILKGSVRAPASIISHNGGNIISNNGGGIVSNNGGGIISHNGGNLQIAQLPLAFTTVRVKDAAGQPVKDDQGRELVAKTDANGNYSFPVEVKGRNLVIEADVKGQSGKLRSLLPKEGVKSGGSLDVDMTSTLTLAYILDQYVKGDLNTFERLPKDIEAKARVVTEEAIVEKQIALPTTLDDGAIVAKVDEVRRAEPKVDQVFEEIKKLLVIVGLVNEGDGMPANLVDAGIVGGTHVDAEGNSYVFSQSVHTLWKISPSGVLQTIVAKGGWGYTEQTPNILVPGFHSTIAMTANKEILVSDTYHHRVVKVGIDRRVTVIAGTGVAGYDGDNGLATFARLSHPSGLALDREGNIFVSDSANHRIRKISPDGRISTIVGDGVPGSSGDGGVALAARLNKPQALVLDDQGVLYVADLENSRIRVITNGTIKSLNDPQSFIQSPISLALAPDKTLVCVNHHSGTVVNVKGLDDLDGPTYTDLLKGRLFLNFPRSVSIVGRDILIDDGLKAIWRVDDSATPSRVMGGSNSSQPAAPKLLNAFQMAIDKNDNIFVTDFGAKRIFRVSLDGSLRSIAGNGTSARELESATPIEVGIGTVAGITLGSDGEIIFTSIGNFTGVRSIGGTGFLKMLIGTGKVSYDKLPTGDALAVDLPNPYDVIQLANGEIVFSAPEHDYLLRLKSDGMVDFLVPPSEIGFPQFLVKDHNGVPVVVEKENRRVSRVNEGKIGVVLEESVISPWFSVNDVKSIAFNKGGELYIASQRQILVVSKTQQAKLVAGVGAPILNKETRDEGLQDVRDIEFSSSGDLYILEPDQIKRVPAGQLPHL